MKTCKLWFALFLLSIGLSCLSACQDPTPVLTYVPATEATCDKEGNVEYWLDEATGARYRDKDGKVRTTKDAVTVARLSHAFGDWEVIDSPNTSATGMLIRTCENDATHTESVTLPILDEKNGYRLTYEWGEETGERPTFVSEGICFYVWRQGNQSFMFEEFITSLEDYYDGRADTVLYTPSDYDCTNGVLNEEEGTLLLNGSSSALSLTVSAAEDGFYSLYLKYCNEGSKTTRVTVTNESYPAWAGLSIDLLAASSKNDTKTYIIPYYEVDRDFPAEEAVTVYLKKGENDLTLRFSEKIGVGRMLLVEKQIFTEDTPHVLLPCEGGAADNGVKITGDAPAEVSLTVPADGVYTVYGLISTSGTRYRLASATDSFPAQYYDIAVAESGGSESTHYKELGKLRLTAGDHTLRISLSGDNNNSSDYLHYNFIALVKTDDLDAADDFSYELQRSVNEDTGEVSVTLHTSGTTPKSHSPRMKVVVSGYYTHADGTETPFTKEFAKTDYNQSFRFTTDPLTGNMDGVSYRVRIYDETGEILLDESRILHYSNTDTLKVLFLSDLHYVGSNVTQYLRNYKYNEKDSYGWAYRVLKTLNYYRPEYEAWGWSSDEKLQRVMDDLIQRYEAGEFDIVFFLGDQSMNDGNYYNYAEDHMMYKNQPNFGESIDDFWDAPLNHNYMLQENFLNQLSEVGIPYFCSNGNHDYLVDYNEEKTDVTWQAWEDEYHYQELFGHKNADGTYYDATPDTYFVRVIRRDGEVKILTAMSSEELEIFIERNIDDGGYYDCYVSEDTLTDSDVRLGAFLSTAGYQIDSYKNYMTYFTYAKDPATGERLPYTDFGANKGQTIHNEYLLMDVVYGMAPMLEEWENVYALGHNTNKGLSDVIAAYPNIKAFFMGDVHTEETTSLFGLLTKWVVGCFSCAYDVDYYRVYDESGNPTGEKDKQYYYYKNGSVGDAIGGDYREHPFAYLMLHVKGTEAYVEREQIAFFYANEQPEYRLFCDRVTGWDPNYTRAVDLTHEAGESFTVGNRTVYVGGDCFVVGQTHLNVAYDYEKAAYNPPEYMLSPLEGSTYTVCDLAGRPIEEGLTVTLASTDEGASFTLFGSTYYIVSKVGGAVGHYLYDENGDFVYVDKNGDYVFYDFYTDENGDYVKEYFYENEKGEWIALGEWNEDHTVYTLKDGTYTDMWKTGCPMKVGILDSTDKSELTTKVTAQYKNGKYNVTEGVIEIRNGVIIRGSGFVQYGYAYRFRDAEGNLVDRRDVLVNQVETYTYTLKEGVTLNSSGKIAMASGSLKESDFNVVYNGYEDGYGLYIPHMAYEKQFITK